MFTFTTSFDNDMFEGTIEQLRFMMEHTGLVGQNSKATATAKKLAVKAAEKFVSHELLEGLAFDEADAEIFLSEYAERLDAAQADGTLDKIREALYLHGDIAGARKVLRQTLVPDVRYKMYGEYFLAHIDIAEDVEHSTLYDATWNEAGQEWVLGDGTKLVMPEPYMVLPPYADAPEELAEKCREEALKEAPKAAPAEGEPKAQASEKSSEKTEDESEDDESEDDESEEKDESDGDDTDDEEAQTELPF